MKLDDVYWKVLSVLYYSRIFGSLGRRSWIRRPLALLNGRQILIGGGCLIRDGARLEIVNRQGHARAQLIIGNNVTIEQDAHIVAADRIVIEDEVCFAPRCTLIDTPHPVGLPADGNRTKFLADGSFGIHIERRVFLGANVVVLDNVRIGENSIVGAGSVVTRDIPANSIAIGAPARVIKTIDSSGKTHLVRP